MIDLVEAKNGFQTNKKNATNRTTAENITALYERLSRDDDMEGESNSLRIKRAFLRHTHRNTASPTAAITPMTVSAAAALIVPAGNK